MKQCDKKSLLTLCLGAAGMSLRLLQNMTGFEPGTGLPIPGSIPGILLPVLLALRAELQAAQSELALAYRQFDQATAPELVESCIYRISAAKARCDYYLRVLKAREPVAAGSAKGGAVWT